MVAALCLPLVRSAAAAPTIVRATGSGDAYPLLQRVYGLELPDCGHNVKHITQTADSDLGRPAFVFHSHAALDDDRCGKTDRQRGVDAQKPAHKQSADAQGSNKKTPPKDGGE